MDEQSQGGEAAVVEVDPGRLEDRDGQVRQRHEGRDQAANGDKGAEDRHERVAPRSWK